MKKALIEVANAFKGVIPSEIDTEISFDNSVISTIAMSSAIILILGVVIVISIRGNS